MDEKKPDQTGPLPPAPETKPDTPKERLISRDEATARYRVTDEQLDAAIAAKQVKFERREKAGGFTFRLSDLDLRRRFERRTLDIRTSVRSLSRAAWPGAAGAMATAVLAFFTGGATAANQQQPPQQQPSAPESGDLQPGATMSNLQRRCDPVALKSFFQLLGASEADIKEQIGALGDALPMHTLKRMLDAPTVLDQSEQYALLRLCQRLEARAFERGAAVPDQPTGRALEDARNGHGRSSEGHLPPEAMQTVLKKVGVLQDERDESTIRQLLGRREGYTGAIIERTPNMEGMSPWPGLETSFNWRDRLGQPDAPPESEDKNSD